MVVRPCVCYSAGAEALPQHKQWAGCFQSSPGEQVLGDPQLSFRSSSRWDPKDPVRGALCQKE